MKRLLYRFLLILTLFPASNLYPQTCTWKFKSEIDCHTDLIVGFTCDCATTTHHHPFSTTFECPYGCGCWGQPGDFDNIAGCGYCGNADTTLCSISGLGNDPILKFIKTRTQNPPIHPPDDLVIYDWRNVKRDRDTVPEGCGANFNTIICCGNINPDSCQSCACGVVEIDWQLSLILIKPAYNPYYPLCPGP